MFNLEVRDAIMNIRCKAIAFLFAVLGFAQGVDADLIVLADGREYAGMLVQAAEDVIRFRTAGEIREFDRDEVMAVHLQRERAWDAFSTVAEADDPALNRALGVDTAAWRRQGAGAAWLHQETRVDLRTSQTWERRDREIVEVLNEHGEAATIRNLRFLEDVETADVLHGVSITADGRIVHMRDTAMKTESVHSEDARYDHLKQHRFALPEGKPGTVLDVATATTRVQPREWEHFYDEFSFGRFDPVAERVVEIVAPADVPLQWRVVNDPGGVVEFSREVLPGGGQRLRWERRDAPLLLPEPNMPPLADIVPRLVISAWPDEWDWEELGRKQSEQFERQAEGITAGDCGLQRGHGGGRQGIDGGDNDIVSLWHRLADAVSVMPVGSEVTGWMPTDPGRTWALRRASQLDRTFLLFCELRKMGVDVRWAWYRSRSRGALVEEVVGLQAFDSPVLVVPAFSAIPPVYGHFMVLGDELDSVPDPLVWLGGLAVLTGDAGVTVLPIPESGENSETHRIAVRVVDAAGGDAEVTEEIDHHGVAAREIRMWRRLPQADRENRVRAMVRARFARAAGIEWEFTADIENDRERRQGLKIRYRVPGLVDVRRRLAVTQWPWLEFAAGGVGRETRRFAMEWAAPVERRVVVSWDVPGTWTLLSVPEVFEEEVAGIARVVAVADQLETGSGMRYVVELVRRGLSVPPGRYAEFRGLVERRSRLGELYWLWSTTLESRDR